MVFYLLHPRLQEALGQLGYFEPTPAQREAIPAILEGRHVLLVAPTGFGKTEAALLPVLSKLIDVERGGVRCVYITPLRSLNRDLLTRLRRLAQSVGLSIAVRHGDTTKAERSALVKNPPDVLITTPESLQILLLHRKMRDALRHVRHVVVDEVHELVESKRGVQLALGLERLVELAGEFQRVGLSATVGAPGIVAGFLGGSGRDVYIIDVSGEKKFEVDVVLPTPSEEDYADAERFDVTPETMARLRRVADYVKQTDGKVLIFTNTRDGAEFLASRLKRLAGDVVEVHHSSLAREHRVSVEERLRGGDVKAVVATSSLELGIDIGDVELVIQYSSPRQVSKLVQRVGRSGHKLGLTSRGIVVVSDLEDMLESEEIARRALSKKLEGRLEYHENALDVLMHQVVGIALEARLEGREVDIDYVRRIVTRAHLYRNLTYEDLRFVLDFAEIHGLLRGLRPRKGSVKYYFENVSTIPDEKNYRAVDKSTGTTVGELVREFVFSLEPGSKIVLSGRVWTYSAREGDVVFLYPDYDIQGSLPAWLGEQIPVPFEVARDVCTARSELLGDALRGEVGLDIDLEGLSEDLLPRPGELHIHVVGSRYAVVHSCLGHKGNEALGLYLSHALSGYVGPVGYRADAYRVLLIFRDFVPARHVAEVLTREEEFVFRTLRNAIKSSKMFRYKFLHVAKRVGIVSKDAEEIPHRLVDAYVDDLPGVEAINEIYVEKVDVEALLWLLSRVKSGELRLVVKNLAKPTLLEKPILEEALRLDFSFRGLSKEMIVDMARRRILNRQTTLLCLNCGWHLTTRVASLPDDPSCPACGFRALSVLKGIELSKARSVLDKFRIRQRLTHEEKKMLENLQQSAAIVLEHGKLGVVVQMAHGVGPKTAVKILNKILGGGDLWSIIVDAERQYAATRAFWD